MRRFRGSPPVWVVLGLVLGSLTSCRKPDTKPVPRVQVPRPASVWVEATASGPQAVWKAVQAQVGGAAYLLPASVGSLVGDLARLPTEVSEQIDGSGSAVLVGTAGGYVLSFQLRDARRAAHAEPESCVRRPLPDAGSVEIRECSGVAYAVTPSGRLALGPDQATLTALVPYIDQANVDRAETAVETQGIHVEVFPRAFLDVFPRTLKQYWADVRQSLLNKAQEHEKALGRPADFAEPRAIVAGLDDWVTARLAALAAITAAHIDIVPTQDTLRITAAFEGETQGVLGRPLRAAVPSGMCNLGHENASLVFCVQSETEDASPLQPDWIRAARSVFGQRMTEAEATALEQTLDQTRRAMQPSSMVELDMRKRTMLAYVHEAPTLGKRIAFQMQAGFIQKPLSLGKRTDALDGATFARSRSEPLVVGWNERAVSVGLGEGGRALLAEPALPGESKFALAHWLLAVRPHTIGIGKPGPPATVFAQEKQLSISLPAHIVREVVRSAF